MVPRASMREVPYYMLIEYMVHGGGGGAGQVAQSNRQAK